MQNASNALSLLGTQQGMDQAHPQEVQIRRQNEERIARRRAAATLADQVVGGRDELTRHGSRKIGGTFEQLQAVPGRAPTPTAVIGEEDMLKFLSAFQFEPSDEVVTGDSKIVRTETFAVGGSGLAATPYSSFGSGIL